MMSDINLKGKEIFEPKDIKRLRQAIIEIIKEETVPYDSTKPDKKELELKELRDKLVKRLNDAFGVDCRYCECGGEIRPTIDFFEKENREKKKKDFKERFGKELPDLKNYNCINCGQCFDENFKKMSIRLGWL